MSPFLLDLNVVVAASREDHTHHAIASRWLDGVLDSQTSFTVPVQVWSSFLRLVTNRRVFPDATPLSDAFAFISAVTSAPGHLRLTTGPRHLDLLRSLCEEGGAIADLVADAVLAAIAVEHNCIVATMDRDFARFPSVEHVLLRT